MSTLKTLEEHDASEPITEILKKSKDEKSCSEYNSNFAKKRKLSCRSENRTNDSNNSIDERKNDIIHKHFKQGIASCRKDSDSKSTQALSPCFQELLEDELRCSICKEMFIRPVTLNCSHSFCAFCISQWKREQSTCPICRQEINSENATLALDRCVHRVTDFSSEKLKERRQQILLDRENQTRIQDTSYSDSSHCDSNDTSHESSNSDFFEILEYIFDNGTDPIYDDFDQCIIN